MLIDSAHEAYWLFTDHVKLSRRFVRSREVDVILQEIVACAATADRQCVIATEHELWRAQLGYKLRSYQEGGVELDQLPYAFHVDRMKPGPSHVGDGRANPAGVACLYAATDRETAVAEMRPWRGGFVSLSAIRVVRNLKLADLTAHGAVVLCCSGDRSPEERSSTLWGLVDEDFARPIDPQGRRLEYVPTQIVAEALRAAEYDGIRYTSALGPGHNIVIFDPADVAVESPSLCRIDSVAYDFAILPHRTYEDGSDIAPAGD